MAAVSKKRVSVVTKLASGEEPKPSFALNTLIRSKGAKYVDVTIDGRKGRMWYYPHSPESWRRMEKFNEIATNIARAHGLERDIYGTARIDWSVTML